MDSFYIFPLTVISTQTLLLLVTIALESLVIQQQMKVSPRQSIEFSTSLNLFSTFLGWLIFFSLSGPYFISNVFKVKAFNFILFQQWDNTLITWIILLGFITFFSTVAVEWLGFIGLQWFLNDTPAEENSSSGIRQRFSFRPVVQPKQLMVELTEKPDILRTMLLSNASSYIVILLILAGLRLIRVI